MDIDVRIAVLMQGDYSLPTLIIGDPGLDASLDYIRVDTSYYTCVSTYACFSHKQIYTVYIYAAASECIHVITRVRYRYIHPFHIH